MTIRRTRVQLLLSFLVVALPLEVLVDLRNNFYYDWVNHVWLIAYYGDFFRAHWMFPDVLHTSQVVGIVQPMFYGHLFYAAGGVLGSVLGADLTIRVGAFAVLAAQFYSVLRLFDLYSGNRTFSMVVATLMTWSTYPLTNFYNRGAITEFFAVCFLTMAICAALASAARPEPRARAFEILAAGFLFMCGAATHPITGLLGGVMFSFLLLLAILVRQDRVHGFLAASTAAFLTVAVLSPWLYVLYRFQQYLPINEMKGIITYTLDTFLGRIAPFPFDIRSLMSGARVDSPYLDAQVAMAAVAMLAGIWWSFRRTARLGHVLASPDTLFARRVTPPAFSLLLGGLSGCLFVYLFLASLGLIPALVPSLLARAQFGYRLVSYLNVCLLLLIVAATQHYAGREYRRDAMVATMAIAFALSFSGVILKLAHAHVARQGESAWETLEERTTLPLNFYSLGDYNVLNNMNVLMSGRREVSVAFTPSAPDDFGALEPLSVPVDLESTVKTNIYAFPWNKVLVDGREVRPDSYIAPRYGFFHPVFLSSVTVPPGNHQIEYKFEPDQTWLAFRRISLSTFLLWAVGLSVWALAGRLARSARGCT